MFPLLDAQTSAFAYLDSAATTQKPRAVIEAVEKFYRETNSNVHRGLYPLSEKATALYEAARRTSAQFLNAETDEIIFTSGATASLNELAQSLEAQFHSGDTILLFEGEHHSNLLPWMRLADRRGCRVAWIPTTTTGAMDLPAALALLQNETVKLFAVATVSHVLGDRHPYEQLVRVAKARGAICVLDATQSVARELTDVKAIGCDALVFSSHKIYGPTGAGALFANRELQKKMEPVFVGGGMVDRVSKTSPILYRPAPWKFEAGTPPIEGVVGLKAALDFVNEEDLFSWSSHERDLIEDFAKYLSSKPGVRLLGWAGSFNTGSIDAREVSSPSEGDLAHSRQDQSNLARHEGILSFTLEGLHPHDVAQTLADGGVAVRAGHHCAHLLADRIAPDGCVRISLAAYNTYADLELFKTAFEKCLELRDELKPTETVWS